jgi:hypothetical protein
MVEYGMVYGTVPIWHCQCNNGLRKAASPPQNLPFPPPAYSSHALMPHNAFLNVQLGGRAQQRLAWKLKVGRSTWFLVDHLCFIQLTVVWDRNWSQTTKLHQSRIVQWPASSTIQDRTSQLHRLSSVRYGVIRYGIVITVKIALVRRSRTSLFKIRLIYTCIWYLTRILPYCTSQMTEWHISA